jgi:hypothetical protein
MNKKYFYKYAISKQQQIQKESNHLFQVALLFLKNLIFKITTPLGYCYKCLLNILFKLMKQFNYLLSLIVIIKNVIVSITLICKIILKYI